MVHFCAVFGCANRSKRDKDERFFRLPSVKPSVGQEIKSAQENRGNEWLKRIKRQDLTPGKFERARICSDHFVSGKS